MQMMTMPSSLDHYVTHKIASIITHAPEVSSVISNDANAD